MTAQYDSKRATAAWLAMALVSFPGCEDGDGSTTFDASSDGNTLEGGTMASEAGLDAAERDAGWDATLDATEDAAGAEEAGVDSAVDAAFTPPEAGSPEDAQAPDGDATPFDAGSQGTDGAPRDASIDAADASPLVDAALDASHVDSGVPCTTRYEAGHGDIYAAYDDGAGLTLHLRSHLSYPAPGGVEPLHAPETVCIVVPGSSRQDVIDMGGRPADDFGFGPVGVAAGEPFWFLSNSNLGAAQPFLGVATEGVAPSDVTTDVTFAFEQVDAPASGEMAVYFYAGFELVFLVSTADPSATRTGSQEIRMPAGGHDHYVWSFTAPGHYAVGVAAETADSEGHALRSELETYHFIVEE